MLYNIRRTKLWTIYWRPIVGWFVILSKCYLSAIAAEVECYNIYLTNIYKCLLYVIRSTMSILQQLVVHVDMHYIKQLYYVFKYRFTDMYHNADISNISKC